MNICLGENNAAFCFNGLWARRNIAKIRVSKQVSDRLNLTRVLKTIPAGLV
jgi:hypothetical protein